MCPSSCSPHGGGPGTPAMLQASLRDGPGCVMCYNPAQKSTTSGWVFAARNLQIKKGTCLLRLPKREVVVVVVGSSCGASRAGALRRRCAEDLSLFQDQRCSCKCWSLSPGCCSWLCSSWFLHTQLFPVLAAVTFGLNIVTSDNQFEVKCLDIGLEFSSEKVA